MVIQEDNLIFFFLVLEFGLSFFIKDVKKFCVRVDVVIVFLGFRIDDC